MSQTRGYRVNAGHIVSDVFDDGEAAVIDLRTGSYYSLNPIGAVLWPLVVEGCTIDALVAYAVAATDGGSAVAPAVERFVMALLAEDLVEEVDNAEGAAPATPAGDPLPFAPPELERFDDLKELLLLDPIHDVSDRGWPYTPPE